MKLNFTVIICAVAAIICAGIVGNAYKYKFKTAETIAVTGLAEKEFESDKIVWNANYSKKSMDLKIIDPNAAVGEEKNILEVIHNLARKAGLKVLPEVGIYNSPELNAFATGPTKNNSLVAFRKA